ncbi:MAG: repair protein RecN [Pseudomonadota bacterium]
MSWRRIAIRDFVIVDTLELDIDAGFSVLTGETGAGKSILIDALQLALGGRADASVVREGATRCDIAVEFDTTPLVLEWLDNHGYATEGGSLLLRRQVDQQGRSRAWVNGGAATAGQLRELADWLIDIHGQHAWQSLTRPDQVRTLLDSYAQLNTQALKERWQQWRHLQRNLEEATASQAQRQEERERLQWQLTELGQLHPQIGEWEELNLRHGRLANAQSLVDAAAQALAGLDDEAGGALARVQRAAQTLRAEAPHEPRFEALALALDSIQDQLQDLCRDLQHHTQHAEPDPEALQILDARLSGWLSMARRYRCTPETLPDKVAQMREQLLALDRQTDLEQLQRDTHNAYQSLAKAAAAVSKARRQAARNLGEQITAAMQRLGMAGGVFEVRLTPLDGIQAHGQEAVEFLVAGHPGATPRPVGKVASGGELSRIALAISVTTSQLGQAPTLVFDEVDSGIGGAVAQTVGQLMRQLGQDRQVLAVTHLPQVAACAHHHLLVSKHPTGGTTTSRVQGLDTEARVGELARMLGGQTPTPTSLAHARELLNP